MHSYDWYIIIYGYIFTIMKGGKKKKKDVNENFKQCEEMMFIHDFKFE